MADFSEERHSDHDKRFINYKTARDFFRIFTFTCGVVEDGKQVPANAVALPEFETMNWLVTESDFRLFTDEIWTNNKERFDQLVKWLQKVLKANVVPGKL